MKTTNSLRKKAQEVLEAALNDEDARVRLSACRIVLGMAPGGDEDEDEMPIFEQAAQRHEAQQASRGFARPEDDEG